MHGLNQLEMFNYDFPREIKSCSIYYVITIAKSAIVVRGILCCKDVEIMIFFLNLQNFADQV